MDYIKVIYSSIISIAVLFFLAKLIGNRQISQLSLFDYINGITIGSIAAEMATSLEKHWTLPLLAMVIYGLATAFISYICCKSQKVRRFCNGKAIILFDKGKFRYNALKRSKLDMNEFLMQCRADGYFDLSEIETAVMEPNGKISFLPKAENRPVTPNDMALSVPKSGLCFNLVIDGNVLESNLISAGKDKKWLSGELSKSKCKTIEEVLLATLGADCTVSFYKKEKSKIGNDVFA